jgi:hypothetical protein
MYKQTEKAVLKPQDKEMFEPEPKKLRLDKRRKSWQKSKPQR